MSAIVVIFGIVIGLVGWLWFWLKKNLKYWRQLGMACEEPSFLLGNLKGLKKSRVFADIWLEYYRKFKGTGPFAGFYWFQRPGVLVLDRALAKNILIRDFASFPDRGFYHNEKDDPLSGHLFLLDGHKWKSMRAKLTPTFTSGKMKFMFPTVVRVGEEFVRVFGEMTESSLVVEVRELLARFTTDVIGSCAFGIECCSLTDPNAEFRLMGKKSLTEFRHGKLGTFFMASFPNLARKLHMTKTPQYIVDFFLRIVRETVEYRERNKIWRNDFMDMLIELKNKKMMTLEDGQTLTNLTLEEVAAQAFVFFAAGFETSSTTMGFALYELAQHQDVQQRAREEVQRVFANHNQEFTYECMKEMGYLDQIISETLRLYTVVPVLSRVCRKDYVVPGHPKYVIKNGMNVFIPAAAFHRDPELYPNPDEFDPDNFSPKMVMNRDPMEWMPFGEGPRNCIGMRFGQMQTRIGLALLLKNFEFTVCDRTTIPMEYDKKSILLSPNEGIYLIVTRLS